MWIILTPFYRTSITSIRLAKQSSRGMLFRLVAPQEASGGARYASSLLTCMQAFLLQFSPDGWACAANGLFRVTYRL